MRLAPCPTTAILRIFFFNPRISSVKAFRNDGGLWRGRWAYDHIFRTSLHFRTVGDLKPVSAEINACGRPSRPQGGKIAGA